MPPEDHKSQKKIQCWIPLETWDKIVSLGYTSPTIAVTKAFEKLLEDHREDPPTFHEDPQQIPEISPKIHTISPEIPILEARNEELQRKIKDLEENLRKAPDLVEFAQLRTRSEELEKHNQALKGDMEKQLSDKERELEFLKGQITIKDQQIDKQAFSLQSVIQENSRLNLKLLPESQETNNTQEQKLTRWQYLKGFLFGIQ